MNMKIREYWLTVAHIENVQVQHTSDGFASRKLLRLNVCSLHLMKFIATNILLELSSMGVDCTNTTN